MYLNFPGLRETKVADTSVRVPLVQRNQNVLRRDVAVDGLLVVQSFESVSCMK
jgi:hypothetical protein